MKIQARIAQGKVFPTVFSSQKRIKFVEIMKDLTENVMEIHLVKEDLLKRAKAVVTTWERDTQLHEIEIE